MSDRTELIADLLMGAALADAHLDGRELEIVKKILSQAMFRKSLPTELEARLQLFERDALDIAATVAQLELETDDDKRYLLELIGAVHDADGVWDIEEDSYLREVAEAMGLAEEAYADLTLEVISLEQAGKALMPPPLPGAKPKPPPLPK